MERDITPPPSKRRRTVEPQEELGLIPPPISPQPPPSSTPRSAWQPPPNESLRVYSWNINGITPYIQAHLHKPITSYFTPASNSTSPAKRKPSSSSAASPKRTPSRATPDYSTHLRQFLKRHNWPQCLFLQETKIAPGDVASQAAVGRAINPPPRLPSPRSASLRPPAGSLEEGREEEVDDGPSYTAHFCLPSDRFNAKGFGRKIYGVCSVVRDDWARREGVEMRTVDWDGEGRVLVHLTNPPGPQPAEDTAPGGNAGGARGGKLALWNLYLVNGTENPYYSPETGKQIGTRHTRKLQVHTLLLQHCKQLERQGYHILLAGDMNVAPSPLDGHPNLRTFPHQHVLNRADFNEKFLGEKGREGREGREGVGLVDSFRWVRGRERRFTYFPRSGEWGSSADRVDLILVSRGLVGEDMKREGERVDGEEKEDEVEKGGMGKGEGQGRIGALVEADMLDSEMGRAGSDHVPLWVELDLSRLKSPMEETEVKEKPFE